MRGPSCVHAMKRDALVGPIPLATVRLPVEFVVILLAITVWAVL